MAEIRHCPIGPSVRLVPHLPYTKTCFQNARKCVFLGVILQKFFGACPGPPYNGRDFGTPQVDL